MFKEEPQIYLNIKFNNTEEALPVNPEKLQITRSATNTNIDIVGLGPATRKGYPGLISMKISSFFPHLNSPFNYFGKSPEYYIKFLNDIWEAENDNNRVATLTTIGLTPRIDTLPFVIESFDYEHRGGDFDIYYNLSIKEYVPYGAKVKTISSNGTKTSRIASGEVSKSKTYTVVRGDTLSGITKRCTGGTGDWRVLYELNKNIIGGNPNLIRVGQVLTLPDDWNAPVKSTASTKTKSSSTTKKVEESNKNISQTSKDTNQNSTSANQMQDVVDANLLDKIWRQLFNAKCEK